MAQSNTCYALRMRRIATAERFVTMTDECRNEIYARSAALKRHPDCVVDDVRQVTREVFDTFAAYAQQHNAPA
jgi:hypothetical protein